MKTYILVFLVAAVVPVSGATAENCGATKIFLLAGQSNMVGMGSVEHLQKLLNDTETHNEYAPLYNETTKDWTKRPDVLCKFNDRMGPLQVGFGAADDGGNVNFGPELGYGWVLGDTMCECQKPILLLKTAWGGKNLAIDFRPPSSGKGDYEGVHPVTYGWEYRQMITDILGTLGNLTNIIPSYNKDEGFQLAGFVWFQGWNDMIDRKKVDEYEYNLANLIRDVRDDLDAPTMPFIIGGMGQKGLNATGEGADRYYDMQKAQRMVTLQEEFRNNTLYVPTAQFMNYPGNDTYNGDYHYYGRADVYYHIGQAFGRGMLRIMGTESATTPLWPVYSDTRQSLRHSIYTRIN